MHRQPAAAHTVWQPHELSLDKLKTSSEAVFVLNGRSPLQYTRILATPRLWLRGALLFAEKNIATKFSASFLVPTFEMSAPGPPRKPSGPSCDSCGQQRHRSPLRDDGFDCVNRDCTASVFSPRSSDTTSSSSFSEETTRIVPPNAYVDQLKNHFDSGFKRLVDDILRQLRPTHEQLLKIVEESRAEVATLAARVTEMRDTIKSLTAQNGGLRNELQMAHVKLSKPTSATTAPPPPPATPPSPATPTPPARTPSKRKRTGSQSPHQPTKHVWDTSPTHCLKHSKHAGPSVTTGPIQPPPTASEPPRGDTEEGWKKVERKRGKGKPEKKVGYRAARGVLTWADIARDGGVSVSVFTGGGAGCTKPKARRPARKGKNQRGQPRPASPLTAG
jgi:hypothetical protein